LDPFYRNRFYLGPFLPGPFLPDPFYRDPFYPDPFYLDPAKHVELLDNGSTIAGDVRLDSAGADYDLTEPEAEIIAKITARLPSELSEVQQAITKALLVHHRKILSTGDHAIVGCRIDRDDVRQIRSCCEDRLSSLRSLVKGGLMRCWSMVWLH